MNYDLPEGFELVKIGDHEIPMTTDEAAGLTDADRVAYAAWIDAEDAAIEARLISDAKAEDRVRAAAAEKGAVLRRVRCSRCRDGRDAVAEVRTSSQGLVFVGTMNVGMDPAQEKRLMESFRARTKRRVPYVAHGRVIALLSEGDSVGNDWPPRAECPMHGELDLDPDELLRSPKTKLVAHPKHPPAE